MKKNWKEPNLAVLDIKETMLGSWKGGHDLLFDFDGKGWVPDDPGHGDGGDSGGDDNLGS